MNVSLILSDDGESLGIGLRLENVHKRRVSAHFVRQNALCERLRSYFTTLCGFLSSDFVSVCKK